MVLISVFSPLQNAAKIQKKVIAVIQKKTIFAILYFC